MANNRELSQLASFVSVNDTNKSISFASTISSLNVSGVVTAASFNGNLTGTTSGINVSGIGTITRLESTNVNVSGAATVGFFTAVYVNGTNENVIIGPSTTSTNITASPDNVLIGLELVNFLQELETLLTL